MDSAESLGIALGLFLALGIFALKTAVGNYYYLSLPGRPSVKIVFLIAVQVLYAVLFLLIFALLRRVDFFRTADSSAFLHNGAAVHLVMCAGLIYWGVRLLIRREPESISRLDGKGWLLLTVPCPVCASAVFLTCAFALMLFPDRAEHLRWLIPLFFLLAELFFLGLLAAASRIFRLEPLTLTGRMMILIALYFILILLLAPHFQSAGKLYAAACSPERCAAAAGIGTGWRMILFAGIAAAAGLVWNFTMEKRS